MVQSMTSIYSSVLLRVPPHGAKYFPNSVQRMFNCKEGFLPKDTGQRISFQTWFGTIVQIQQEGRWRGQAIDTGQTEYVWQNIVKRVIQNQAMAAQINDAQILEATRSKDFYCLLCFF